MTPTNAYTELSAQRLDRGRGYDKRSVETFRARALDLVDELLRQVTELEDRLTAGGVPALSDAETELLHAFRYADSFQRREALAALERSSGLTSSPADAELAAERDSVDGSEFEEWLLSFGDAAARAAPSVVELDLRTPEPPTRLPLRVGLIDHSPRPPTPPTPWGGWVD